MRRLFLTATTLALLATPVLAQEAAPALKPATLEVVAAADVKAAPDMATISTGVMTQGTTAATALSANASAMNKLFAALKALGIPAADIQTSGLNVNPQYVYRDNEAPHVTGYQAINTLSVRLTRLDTVGSVIDTLVKEGSNQISGPTFGIDKPDPLLDNARREAVGKARARAALLAEAAGLKLGRILSISETAAASPPPMPMMRMAAMADGAASSPVAAGQLSLSASVTMVFELTP